MQAGLVSQPNNLPKKQTVLLVVSFLLLLSTRGGSFSIQPMKTSWMTNKKALIRGRLKKIVEKRFPEKIRKKVHRVLFCLFGVLVFWGPVTRLSIDPIWFVVPICCWDSIVPMVFHTPFILQRMTHGTKVVLGVVLRCGVVVVVMTGNGVTFKTLFHVLRKLDLYDPWSIVYALRAVAIAFAMYRFFATGEGALFGSALKKHPVVRSAYALWQNSFFFKTMKKVAIFSGLTYALLSKYRPHLTKEQLLLRSCFAGVLAFFIECKGKRGTGTEEKKTGKSKQGPRPRPKSRRIFVGPKKPKR